MTNEGQQPRKNSGQSQPADKQPQPSDESPDKQQSSGEQQNSQGSGAPEWTTFSIGLAVVLAVSGLLTYLHYKGEESPPEFRVTPLVDEVRQGPAGYYLPVEVRNDGDETAEDVLVQVTLEPPDGKAETVSFSIRFLPGGRTERATVLFSSQPEAARLSTTLSFKDP